MSVDKHKMNTDQDKTKRRCQRRASTPPVRRNDLCDRARVTVTVTVTSPRPHTAQFCDEMLGSMRPGAAICLTAGRYRLLAFSQLLHAKVEPTTHRNARNAK